MKYFLFCLIIVLSCSEKRTPKRNYNDLPDSISIGGAFYLDECARCHGDLGEGNDKKKYPKLKGGGYTFDELKSSMYYPEGTMPEFDDIPDSLIHQIHNYIKHL